MNKTKPYRGKTFGVVINPLIDEEPINWNNLSSKKIGLRLIDRNVDPVIIKHFLPRKARKLFKIEKKILNLFF